MQPSVDVDPDPPHNVYVSEPLQKNRFQIWLLHIKIGSTIQLFSGIFQFPLIRRRRCKVHKLTALLPDVQSFSNKSSNIALCLCQCAEPVAGTGPGAQKIQA